MDTFFSYARGSYVQTEQLALPFMDDILGTLRGYRIFTAARTVRGKVFHLDDHVNRLFDSAAEIYMEMPHTKEELKRVVEETVAKNNRETSGDLFVEILFSGGPADAIGVLPIGPAHLYIIVFPLKPRPESFYRDGISLAAYQYERQFPSVKLLNYVGGVIANQTVVKQHNAQDALFVSVSPPHYILEGTTFNFSLVSDGVLYTHPFDGAVLHGITLDITLKLAREKNILVKRERLPYEALRSADEAFITSVGRNIIPVIRVDDIVIGKGAPGAMTRSLMKAFEEYLAQY